MFLSRGEYKRVVSEARNFAAQARYLMVEDPVTGGRNVRFDLLVIRFNRWFKDLPEPVQSQILAETDEPSGSELLKHYGSKGEEPLVH